jgi:undecaprenyl diphosphate synthase
VTSVRKVVTGCAETGLDWLSLYALSTENFRMRPAAEVRVLMALLRRFMVEERPTIMDNDIRLRVVGRVEELPPTVVSEVRRTEEMSRNNRGMVLCLALNYGGRAELADAARRLAEDVEAGRIKPCEVDEAALGARLYDPTMPPVDLLVRTAGELRLSNFLPWQLAYSELYVTPLCWPDFRPRDLEKAVEAYHSRHRRFGGLLEGIDR